MRLPRRRFLTLASAAALAAPANAAQAYRWRGVALGAQAQIILDHPKAQQLTARALAEIDRLEDIFSLYRPGSALCRLNAERELAAPPFELLECLATARRVHTATEGRFDPSVQPLWRVLAKAWTAGRPPSEDRLTGARTLIGFDRVSFDSARIVLAPGQELTLNGIAQGYIGDRVARLMHDEGVHDVLIDTGEILALGDGPGETGWPVSVADGGKRWTLTNRALATSAHVGTVFDPAGEVGHILDPLSGMSRRPAIRQISISAPNAALADALSTGLCLARSEREVAELLHMVPSARLEHIQIDQNT